MDKNSVCAVFVIYNPSEDFYKNIVVIQEQVECVVVIDNGSGEQLSVLENHIGKTFIGIINNNHNGIAGALNKGLLYAEQHGYVYLLTMDQDSYLPLHGVETMLNIMERDGLASIGPNFSDEMECDNEISEHLFLITSGNLVKTLAARKVGGYDEKLFIDSVDLDFCLKLKLNNFKFAMANKVFMRHELGEEIEGKFLFFKKKLNYHNAFRQYYIFRNLYVMIYRYKKYFPVLAFKLRIAVIMKWFEVKAFYPKVGKKEILIRIKNGKKDAKSFIQN